MSFLSAKKINSEKASILFNNTFFYIDRFPYVSPFRLILKNKEFRSLNLFYMYLFCLRILSFFDVVVDIGVDLDVNVRD